MKGTSGIPLEERSSAAKGKRYGGNISAGFPICAPMGSRHVFPSGPKCHFVCVYGAICDAGVGRGARRHGVRGALGRGDGPIQPRVPLGIQAERDDPSPNGVLGGKPDTDSEGVGAGSNPANTEPWPRSERLPEHSASAHAPEDRYLTLRSTFPEGRTYSWPVPTVGGLPRTAWVGVR